MTRLLIHVRWVKDLCYHVWTGMGVPPEVNGMDLLDPGGMREWEGEKEGVSFGPFGFDADYLERSGRRTFDGKKEPFF